MDVRVLGPMEVLLQGESIALGGPKQRALLALLVASAPRVVSRDLLIEGVWGEEPSSGARSTLQTHVSNLRNLIGEVIVHDRGGYRLAVDPESIDAVRFTRILEEGRRLVATDPGTAAANLREGLSWWRGRPYADLVDVPGLEPEVRHLEELRLEAVELRIDAELAVGLHGTLIAELEALAEEHPMRERFRAQHMLALYRSGRQAEALRAYRKTESMLADELGVDPSQELQDLELAILQHDDSLLDGATRAVTQRLAFLVTDIEGSTRLWDRHPQAMAGALAIHDRILRETIEGAGGRVFKYTGDGVLAVFPDAGAAAAAAETTQRELAATDWGEVGSIRVRMGCDVGEAEARGGDFFGPPLNRAARLCSIAHGGQVLVSGSAQSEVMAAAPPGLQVRNLGEFHLRGMATPERVSQLVFVGLPADFPELRMDAESALDDRVEVVSLPGYEVRERIGEGAFGVVWRAYQPSVGREVAIKVIRPELASQPSFVRRFEAEARTIARVAHPHIVPLIDFWRDADTAYLVLGLLPGGSLAEALTEERVDRSATRRILAQLGTALDHAHSQGLAHGDLKPANVLLDGAGNAYLSDFGIAARLLYPEVVSSLSSDSSYRAPEEKETGPSPAGDLYALGTLAGVLLNGAPEVEAVLSRATAITPGDRYPSAATFLAELDQALGAEPAEVELSLVSRNPYKGLRAFDETDAADFFGREELVAALLTAVTEHRFVAVVGPSGSGKSSVVRAGLIPALVRGDVDRSEKWLHTVLTPGSDPLQSLAEALQAVSTRVVTLATLETAGLHRAVEGDLLLVVDQFEEIYTMVDDVGVRDRFIDLLVAAVEDEHRVRVVATLRADFYDRPLEDERLGRLVRDGLVTVLPPTREGLVEMITAPSQAVGLRWEPGLAHRIAEDVAHQPGSLPLLQYALTELVERRSGDLLTATDYTRVGGVAGALATRAEDVYRKLTSSQQEAVRQIMLRLVTVDEDSDDTRRRVRRSELESVGIKRADLDTVLDTLTIQRLLLADRDPATRGPTVEVAHEALLREWPRLAGWVDDQREALILGRRFRAALADWDHNHCHDDYLLTGSRLAPFTGWAATAALTAEEQDFYRASQFKDQAERAARRRRRRTLTGILAGAAIVASTFGIIAAVQATRATDQADRALAAEARAEEEAERATAEAERAALEADRARARELSAFATAAASSDPALAKLLAVASTQVFDPTLDTIAILHRAWAADSAKARYVVPDDREVAFLWTDLHPDGTRLVAGGTFAGMADHLAVYDFDEGEQWAWATGDRRVAIDQPRFTADGARVIGGLFLLGNTEGVPVEVPLGVAIWDTETGELVEHIDLGECGVLVPAVSATHVIAHLLESENCWSDFGPDNDEALVLVELETGDQRVLSTDPWTWGGVLSGDGRYLAYDYLAGIEDEAGDEIQVMMSVVEEVATGIRVLEFPFMQDDQLDWGVRALSRDGSLLISGGRPIEAWDVVSGERIAAFNGHAGISSFATFSPVDNTVYSTGEEGTVIHWDAETGTEIASVSPVGPGTVSVASDSVLVSGHSARNAAVVDFKTRGEMWAVDTCGEFVLSNTLSIGGDYALVAEICPHGGVDTFLIDLTNRDVAKVVPRGMHQGMSISPDGTRFIRSEEVGDRESGTGSYDLSLNGPMTVRDTQSGETLTELEGICTWDRSIAGRPHEQDGCALYPETPYPFQPWAVRWSPDSQLVAVSSHPAITNAAIAWDTETGAMLWGHDGCGSIGAEDHIFTPDSSQLILFCSQAYSIEVVDVFSGEVVTVVDFDQRVPGSDRVAFIGYPPVGSTLIAVSGVNGSTGASLLWLDPETFEIDHIEERIHDGTVRAWAISPSGSLVATGSADGVVKVWDVERRVQVHEIAVGDEQIAGVAFLSEEHLAVTPRSGGFYVYTLDVDELLEIVRSSLTRGFTSAECQKYRFESCPSLDEMRGD